MAWCIRPSLSTISLLPERTGSSRYPGLFASSWPSDPGAYELTKHIGNGSSASVYQAHCKQLQATVAVKKLDLDAHCDLAALIREATLLRRFQHQHVLLLYTSFVVGRELWMVMPYMDLGSVRSIMRKTSPQGLDEVLIATIMHSTLQALEYVHRNGGIHRDIKADNILVNSSGEVRLADFGVASDGANIMSFILDRMYSPTNSPSHNTPTNSSSSSSSSGGGSNGSGGGSNGSSDCSCGCDEEKNEEDSSVEALRARLFALRANTFVGTPCWMAPEVMQQLDEGYNNAADIWSVGITLIEMATGRPPLARCHPLRVLSETMHCPPPSLPPDSGNRRYSKALRDLVGSCLQKDPSKRPSATELLTHRFFRAARDPSYLANTLLTALLQPPCCSTTGSTALPAESSTVPDSTASAPAVQQQPGSTINTCPVSRKVHSEPLMARLRSVLGLGPGLGPGGGPGLGLGSFLGPRASRLSVTGGAKSEAFDFGNIKERLAAAGGGEVRPRDTVSWCSASAPPAAAAASRGDVASSGSAAGSLSRSGSRGVKASVSAAEAARYSWYAK